MARRLRKNEDAAVVSSLILLFSRVEIEMRIPLIVESYFFFPLARTWVWQSFRLPTKIAKCTHGAGYWLFFDC